MKRFLFVPALWLCAAALYAGDFADFRPIGFSESGQYYAFAQVGIRDGSGFPFAEAWVIDVQKNEQVATGIVELSDGNEGGTGTPEQAFQKAIEAAKLERFSINKNAFLGTDLLVHLPTDHSTIANNIFAFEARAEGGASGTIPTYEVKVETTKTKPATKDSAPGDYGPALLLKLSIVGREEAKGTVQILQEDKRLPKSRAYPLAYSVRRVTAYQEGLVIILSYTTPGFEGPSVRYMAISGKLTHTTAGEPAPAGASPTAAGTAATAVVTSETPGFPLVL